MINKIKNMETSKKILWGNYLILIVLIVFFIVMLFNENPYCSDMQYVVIAWLGILGVDIATYHKKTTTENVSKGTIAFLNELTPEQLEHLSDISCIISNFKE